MWSLCSFRDKFRREHENNRPKYLGLALYMLLLTYQTHQTDPWECITKHRDGLLEESYLCLLSLS